MPEVSGVGLSGLPCRLPCEQPMPPGEAAVLGIVGRMPHHIRPFLEDGSTVM